MVEWACEILESPLLPYKILDSHTQMLVRHVESMKYPKHLKF